MRRLTTREYRATVADVLGVDGAEPALPQGEADGFDNVSLVQSFHPEGMESLLTTAEQVAWQLFASPELRARLPVCSSGEGCVAGFVEVLALRLFRRPSVAGELEPYVGVYRAAVTRGAAHEAALEQVLVALLASSQLLFRMELLQEPDELGEPVPLDAYAVATRLSYLLWSSAPDPELLRAAAANELLDDEGLGAAVERLLGDPRTSRFAESFAGQWLRVRWLADHPVDLQQMPGWGAEIVSELQTETYAFFAEFLRPNRPWTEFLTAPVPAAGPNRSRLYAPDAEARLGILAVPALLARLSFEHRTSPTLRGAFIRRSLLCSPLPEPPPDVPPLSPEPEEPLGLRATVESISLNPLCADCHVRVDPLGLALEHYDFVGQYRTQYADDHVAVDTKIRLPPSADYPNGLSLDGLNDVSAYVAADPAFMTCLIQKLYTYGLGRVPDEQDGANVPRLAERWQSATPSLRAALSTLVLSKPFRFRRPAGAP